MGVEIKILEDNDTAVKLEIIAEKNDKKWESGFFWRNKDEDDTTDKIITNLENKIDKYYKAW
tara:strand:+ start:580 stop:765 length:186 start_codon:yes stop_codon:yes gene_type:complete